MEESVEKDPKLIKKNAIIVVVIILAVMVLYFIIPSGPENPPVSPGDVPSSGPKIPDPKSNPSILFPPMKPLEDDLSRLSSPETGKGFNKVIEIIKDCAQRIMPESDDTERARFHIPAKSPTGYWTPESAPASAPNPVKGDVTVTPANKR
jgi:hypothetical protein